MLITDLDGDALAAAAASIGSEAVVVAGGRRDQSRPQVEAAVDDAVERFGQLDVAFANAGIFGAASPLAEYPVGRLPAGAGGQRRRQHAGRKHALR